MLATTLSIVAVFLPVAFMGGIIGRFFLQFGVTVSVAVLISLFVSFTLDPMLSSIWYDPEAHGKTQGRLRGRIGTFDKGFERHTGVYRASAALVAAPPQDHAAGCAPALSSAASALSLVGVEFVPRRDLGEAGRRSRPRSAPRSTTPRPRPSQVEAALREFPEVAYTYATINSGDAQRQEQRQHLSSA